MKISLDSLHPQVKILALKFLEKCKEENFQVQIVSTLRTFKEQDELYAKGRTTRGPKVTNAKAGYSYHNYGLAFDAAPVVNGKIDWNNTQLYKKMGAIGKSVGLEWGGDWTKFQDMPHFQWTGGLSIKELLKGKRPGVPDESRENTDTPVNSSMKELKFDSVNSFQQNMGIKADGILGPQSKSILDEILKKPTLKKGSKGYSVRYLQYRLDLSVDGNFGSKTEEALKKWQSKNNLQGDGVCGPKCWSILI